MSNLQEIASAPKLVYYARRSRELGKLASCVDGAQASNALAEKLAADIAVYGLLEKTANRLLETYEALKSPVLKGLGYGAGAAVPLALAGKYVAGEVGDEAKEVAYPVAGAVGGGAALLALSRVFNRDDGHGREDHGNRKHSSEDLVKTGAAAFEVAGSLARVVRTTPDPEMRKLAEQTLQVALAHVADVVGDLILG